MSPHSHPFVLDVRPFRHLPGRFTYSVGFVGEKKESSLHTYASFEEARLAGKAALEAMITAWAQNS